MSDDLFLAWAAGFFDGEGCVLVEMSKEKGCKHGFRTSLHTTVTQTSLPCLQLYLERFGGGITTSENKTPSGRRWAVQYRWSVRNENALNFLKQIQPYVVVKKEQVDAALKYALYDANGKKYGARNPIPDEVMQSRVALRELLQKIRSSMKTEAKPAKEYHG
jgi:LAGLIDADG endonuclease